MLCNLTNKFNQSWNSCSVAIHASKPSAIEVKNYFNKETTNDGLDATYYPNPRLSIWSNYFLLLHGDTQVNGSFYDGIDFLFQKLFYSMVHHAKVKIAA